MTTAAALTAASLLYNAATSGYAGRPAGLTFVRTGNIQTRYRAWGTTGRPVVLVPGAFETADTFAALGARLGTDHRVFALDLTGTGYSQARPPYTVAHDAAQVLAFVRAMGLTGRQRPGRGGPFQRRGGGWPGRPGRRAADHRRHVPRR